MNEFVQSAKKNFDHFVLFHSNEETESVSIKDGKLDNSELKINDNYLFHVWKDNKKAELSTTKLNLSLIDKAIKLVKANKEIEYFYGLPEIGKYQNPDLFDKKVAAISSDELIDNTLELTKGIKEPNLTINQISSDRSIINERIITSSGIDLIQKQTTLGVMGSASIENKSSYWDYEEKTHLFDFNEISEKIKRKVKFYTKGEDLKENISNVVLTPNVVSSLFSNAYLTNFNLKNVEKGKSIFSEKNEEIANENFSIYDNGILEGVIASNKFDFLGSPKQNTPLIKKGILTNFISDFNTAKHNNTINTGNASENGIDFSNIVIEGKESGVDEAIVIDSVIGAHTANSTTTDFSVKAEHVYLLNEKKPLKNIMISGKIKEVIKNIISVGKKTENYGDFITGAIITDKINIIKY